MATNCYQTCAFKGSGNLPGFPCTSLTVLSYSLLLVPPLRLLWTVRAVGVSLWTSSLLSLVSPLGIASSIMASNTTSLLFLSSYFSSIIHIYISNCLLHISTWISIRYLELKSEIQLPHLPSPAYFSNISVKGDSHLAILRAKSWLLFATHR